MFWTITPFAARKLASRKIRMETARIPLVGSVGVAQVSELHAAATAAVAEKKTVVFDFHEASDIDASVLQVILATNTACREQDAKAALVGVSETLSKSLRGCGSDSLLELIEDVDNYQAEASFAPTESSCDEASSDNSVDTVEVEGAPEADAAEEEASAEEDEEGETLEQATIAVDESVEETVEVRDAEANVADVLTQVSDALAAVDELTESDEAAVSAVVADLRDEQPNTPSSEPQAPVDETGDDSIENDCNEAAMAEPLEECALEAEICSVEQTAIEQVDSVPETASPTDAEVQTEAEVQADSEIQEVSEAPTVEAVATEELEDALDEADAVSEAPAEPVLRSSTEETSSGPQPIQHEPESTASIDELNAAVMNVMESSQTLVGELESPEENQPEEKQSEEQAELVAVEATEVEANTPEGPEDADAENEVSDEIPIEPEANTKVAPTSEAVNPTEVDSVVAEEANDSTEVDSSEDLVEQAAAVEEEVTTASADIEPAANLAEPTVETEVEDESEVCDEVTQSSSDLAEVDAVVEEETSSTADDAAEKVDPISDSDATTEVETDLDASPEIAANEDESEPVVEAESVESEPPCEAEAEVTSETVAEPEPSDVESAVAEPADAEPAVAGPTVAEYANAEPADAGLSESSASAAEAEAVPELENDLPAPAAATADAEQQASTPVDDDEIEVIDETNGEELADDEEYVYVYEEVEVDEVEVEDAPGSKS